MSCFRTQSGACYQTPTNALAGPLRAGLDRAPVSVPEGLGDDAASDAVSIAAHADAITPMADATGIELDSTMA